jgi:GAF domain-containing protein
LLITVGRRHPACWVSVDDLDRWGRLLAGAAAEGVAQPRQICELCVKLLGITGAGISMMTAEGNRGLVCATDEVCARIEDLQLTLGEGASVDAVHAGTPVIVSDLSDPGDLAAERWPVFMEETRTVGVRALFAFPLRIGAISVGSLDLYRDRPGDFTAAELTAALMAADAAALALVSLHAGGRDSFADERDRTANHQMQVHQATGMIKVQAGVSIEEAFLMLRARAFADAVPVAALASDVVIRHVRFSMEDR